MCQLKDKMQMLQLTKVLSGLKLGAQGHLIVSSPNNLQEIKDKKKNQTGSVTPSENVHVAKNHQSKTQSFERVSLQLQTKGQRQVRASVIVKDAMVTGRKSRILGYMSSGERV